MSSQCAVQMDSGWNVITFNFFNHMKLAIIYLLFVFNPNDQFLTLICVWLIFMKREVKKKHCTIGIDQRSHEIRRYYIAKIVYFFSFIRRKNNFQMTTTSISYSDICALPPSPDERISNSIHFLCKRHN